MQVGYATERQDKDYSLMLKERMTALKYALLNVVEAIPADRPVIYFDVPVYLNIGDLLINLGTERLLSAHGRRVEHRISAKNYQHLLHRIGEEHTLVMQGGGNMGDIWPVHEDMRQTLLKRFPRNKVVVLPQTAHLRDSMKTEQYAAAYRDHPDCMVFVRDKESYHLVKNKFQARCALAPDTAHYLWNEGGLFHPDFSGQGELHFVRRDIEALGIAPKFAGIDWHDLRSMRSYAVFKFFDVGMRQGNTAAFNDAWMKLWYAFRNRLVRQSVDYFRRYETVCADRLHAVILGSLLGKKITWEDNNYGKLSSYISAWLPELAERRYKGTSFPHAA